ncbi:MAG: cobaltochelatase subunit CobT [Hyphomicrobiales bacterium]|nr:MAG: cobaltochelatase subunit CobT [Hyphomicrobiales bacterium]|tara:strand:+ start:74 stop:1885 length:1812 start_codon:yes stop_codon:yes gene_type:complete
MPDIKENSLSEIIKKTITEATRSIAEEPELEVIFGDEPPNMSGKKIKLRDPGRSLNNAELAVLRGNADLLALKIKNHDQEIHKKYQPSSPQASKLYDLIEEARIEAVGAEDMPGCATNLNARNIDNYRNSTLNNITNKDEAPIGEAIGLIVREALTGFAPPNNTRKFVDLWRPHISDKALEELNWLKNEIHNQEDFASKIPQLLDALDISSSLGDSDPSSSKNEDGESDIEGSEEENTEISDEFDPDESEVIDDQSTEELIDLEDLEGADDEGEESSAPDNSGEIDDSQKFRKQEYKIYTNQYDEIINAEEMADLEELDRLRNYLDKQISNLQAIVARLANKLQRKLMAQQNRSWDFDLEEGTLDTARLVRVVTDPMHPLSFKMERDTDFRDTVVTLLIDNSGSMRGRPIMVAATCADILTRTLERCGVKAEVLGFTTKAWKGGQSRELWTESGKPMRPGRLNDLRHIVYKSADAPWRRSKRNLGLMMKEGILKENIDGEALEWAFDRLQKRQEQRKIMMVISDGAPVDDSSLSVNSGNYLELHLKKIINKIENNKDVELIAIGIGHDVTRYYKRAVTIIDVEELGGAMTEKLAELFDENENK